MHVKCETTTCIYNRGLPTKFCSKITIYLQPLVSIGGNKNFVPVCANYIDEEVVKRDGLQKALQDNQRNLDEWEERNG